MSSAPPIFKRTKSKPAQRTRASPDPDDADKLEEDSPSTLATKLKTKVKKAKTKSRLSFGGDDNEEEIGEVFQVKKSKLSRKLALGTHPASVPLNLDQASISSNRGPTYDQAYLNQLKASTPSSRPPVVDETKPSDSGDIVMDYTESTELYVEEMEAIIPSESSIKVAKERRERQRKMGAAGEDDFISLSVVRKVDEPQGPHPDSRLVREEDELGEGDDEFAEYTSAQERIALGKKSRKAEASKRRDEMKNMIADAEEEDDEEMHWEQEQLRRGGHMTLDSSSEVKVKEIYKPAPIPTLTQIPVLATAMSRLSTQLSQLTTSHANNITALQTMEKERKEIEDREMEMRSMVGDAEEKRAWFSDFKEWVESVATFLDEKYPLLEKLEDDHISLLRERLDMIVQRRRAEDQDDLSTILGSPLPVAQSSEPEADILDDLGRAVPKSNPAAHRRERRAARIARRQRRHQHQQKAKNEDEEGYSTDSSLSPQDASAYLEAIKSLATRTKSVLADVRAEEFRDPGKGKWSVWRQRYPDSYIGAWGGLGVVSVWEFWVRLELVGWDCIEDPRSLDDFRWYKGLYNYSRPGDGDLEERNLGPDGDLVASMLSTAVIPRLCKVVEGGAFDVYSNRHVRRMVNLVEEMEASVENDNAKFQNILKSVVTTFQVAIDDTQTSVQQFLSAHRGVSSFDPEAIPARRRFLVRQMKLLKNLLVWRKYSGERFGVGALAKRLIEECVISIADEGWEVGGEELLRKISAMLPGDLMPSELKRRLDR